MSSHYMHISISDRVPESCRKCPAADFYVTTETLRGNGCIIGHEVYLRCDNADICLYLRQAATNEWLYTVKEGDTTQGISEKLNVAYSDLSQCNGGCVPLTVGDRLIIPRKR